MSCASFPLDQLGGLRKDHIAACQRVGVNTAADVLLLPTHDLTKRLKWRPDVVQRFVRDVSRAIAPQTSCVGGLVSVSVSGPGPGPGSAVAGGAGPSTGAGAGAGVGVGAGAGGNRAGDVSAIRALCASGREHGSGSASALALGGDREKKGRYAEGDWIRTGDRGWDQLLGGGLRLGMVVEIAGESAAGKSHLALSLACAAQIPSLASLPGGTIILTSEREISTSRLSDIARASLAQHGRNDFANPSKIMNGVLTTRIRDVEELDHALSYGIPAMLRRAVEAAAAAAGRGNKGPRREAENGAPGNASTGTGAHGVDGETDGASALAPKPPSSRLMGFLSPEAVQRDYDSTRVSAHTPMGALGTPSQALSARGAAPPRLGLRGRRPDAATHPRAPFRLLILDSITALLRGAETAYSSSSAGLTARSRFLCLIADKLKALAVEYNLAVVVINQVSDVIDRRGDWGTSNARSADVAPADGDDDDANDNDGDPTKGSDAPGGATSGLQPSQPRPSQHPLSSQAPSQQPGLTHSQAWYTTGADPPMLYATQSKWFSGQSSARTKEAALGVVWANAVNVRIMLSRTGRRRVIRQGELEEGACRRSTLPLGQAMQGMQREREAGADVDADADRPGDVVWDAEARDRDEDGEQEKMLIRRAQVVFSPCARSGTVDFVVTATGVHALRETWTLEESGGEVLRRAGKRHGAGVGVGEWAGERAGVVGVDGAEGVGDATQLEGQVEQGDAEGDGYGDLGELEGVPEGWWSGDVRGVVGEGHGNERVEVDVAGER